MHNEKDQDVDRVTPDEEQNSKEQSQIADTLKWYVVTVWMITLSEAIDFPMETWTFFLNVF